MRDEARKHWYAPDCIRAAQANGAFSADLLHALPDAHVEAKWYERIAAFRFYEQAERDAAPEEFPVLVMRENGRKLWLCCFAMEHTERFVESFLANRATS